MLTFTGNSRRGRQINLGGRKLTSRDELLRKAVEQREEREVERKRMNAVRVLQRVVRRRLARLDFARRFCTHLLNLPKESAIRRPLIFEELALIIPLIVTLSDENTLRVLALLSSALKIAKPSPECGQELYMVFRRCLQRKPARSYFVEATLELFEGAGLKPSDDLLAAYCDLVSQVDCAIDSRRVLRAMHNEHPIATLLHYPRSLRIFDRACIVELCESPDARMRIDVDPLPILEVVMQSNEAKVCAWPFISYAVDYYRRQYPRISSKALEVLRVLCSHSYIGQLAEINWHYSSASPKSMFDLYEVVNFLLDMLLILPDHADSLLLSLSVASTRSPVQRLWRALKAEKEIHRNMGDGTSLDCPDHVHRPCVQRSNYWSLLLLLARMFGFLLSYISDAELKKNDYFGLNGQNFREFADVICMECCGLFAKTSGHLTNWNVIREAGPHLLRLLRQLYTRDHRRQFLPDNFWEPRSEIDLLQLHQAARVQLQKGTFLTKPLLDWNHDYDDDEEEENVNNTIPPVEPVDVLVEAPFFVPFEFRAALLYEAIDCEKTVFESYFVFRKPQIQLRREKLLEDAEPAFIGMGSRLQHQLSVQLVSNGEVEAGIDGGGLTKEALLAITEEIFKPKTPNDYSILFVENTDHTLYPNPAISAAAKTSSEFAALARKYRFIGQVIGMCIRLGVLLDVPFSPFFLQKFIGGLQNSFDDLLLLDSEMYNNFMQLMDYDGDFEDLCLTFTTNDANANPVALIPDGEHVPITAENRMKYIHAVADYKLNVSLALQTRHFLLGLQDLVKRQWLSMFDPFELQILIGGDSADFDVEDLRTNAQVSGFDHDSQTPENFWQLVKEMSPKQRSLLLRFATSYSRAPLLGFKSMQPNFAVRCSGKSDTRLPTAATCMNLLKLPDYPTYEILKRKLTMAIEARAGFDLS